MDFLHNPLLRLFLAKMPTSSVTIEIVNSALGMMKIAMPPSMVQAIAETASSQTACSNMLELLESPDMQEILIPFVSGRLGDQASQKEDDILIAGCPHCGGVFELGAYSHNLSQDG